jgi:hypothetical protein
MMCHLQFRNVCRANAGGSSHFGIIGIQKTFVIKFMTEITTPAAVGRPTVITESVVALLEEAFRIDSTVTEACSLAGISRDAYYDRVKKDEEFSDRMSKAQGVPFLLAKKTLMKAIIAGDAKLAMRFLSARQRDRYYEKQQTDAHVSGGFSLAALHEAAEAEEREMKRKEQVVSKVPIPHMA